MDVEEFTTLDGNKRYFVEIKNKDTIDTVFAEGYKILNNPIILKTKFEEIFGIEVIIENKKNKCTVANE